MNISISSVGKFFQVNDLLHGGTRIWELIAFDDTNHKPKIFYEFKDMGSDDWYSRWANEVEFLEEVVDVIYHKVEISNNTLCITSCWEIQAYCPPFLDFATDEEE